MCLILRARFWSLDSWFILSPVTGLFCLIGQCPVQTLWSPSREAQPGLVGIGSLGRFHKGRSVEALCKSQGAVQSNRALFCIIIITIIIIFDYLLCTRKKVLYVFPSFNSQPHFTNGETENSLLWPRSYSWVGGARPLTQAAGLQSLGSQIGSI